jgi:hypothetical protein
MRRITETNRRVGGGGKKEKTCIGRKPASAKGPEAGGYNFPLEQKNGDLNIQREGGMKGSGFVGLNTSCILILGF